MKTANISDLKQHLSARLQSVQAGETLVVTDRHVPVAMLAPLPPGMDEIGFAGIIADGAMAPRQRPLDLAAFRSLPRASWAAGLSAAIIAERDGR